MDELGENLCSELSGGPAQYHQLDPLGDAVAQGDGTLHHGDVLHAAVANVVLIVCKLAWRRGRVKTALSHFPQSSSPVGYSPIFCRRTWTPGRWGARPARWAPGGRRGARPSFFCWVGSSCWPSLTSPVHFWNHTSQSTFWVSKFVTWGNKEKNPNSGFLEQSFGKPCNQSSTLLVWHDRETPKTGRCCKQPNEWMKIFLQLKLSILPPLLQM